MKKRWQFTKKGLSSSTSKQKKQENSTTSSLRLYQGISDLPLTRFIDCSVDGNLYALVISGKPTEEELQSLWDKIKLQYADVIKDAEYKLYASISNELARLEITYSEITSALRELKNYYTKEFAGKVNEWLRSSFKFNVELPDDYDNDLKRAGNRSKGIKLDIDLKKMTVEAMKKKFDSKGAATRESFQAILITLSDHVKYEIRESITVYEYCERIHRCNKYYDSLNNKPIGRR